MLKSTPHQISVTRDGLLVSRRLTATVADAVPAARHLVRERFGRRPLHAVEVIVTSPKRLARIAAISQGEAAGVPADVFMDKTLSLTTRPGDLYSVTVIAPKGVIRILVNSTRVRRRTREIGGTLVWAFVEADQLCRKGAVERRIALTRHEMGTDVLPKGKARSLYRIEAEMEAEAAKVTGQILGKVVRQNRHAETQAAHEVRPAENAAA
ncbi:hypothetical protein [Streptomyces niveus]|uniref:hypothetical protein n=1 Tax=Streptomyces niveus TaxID=193462 RepID=UPI0037A5DE05